MSASSIFFFRFEFHASFGCMDATFPVANIVFLYVDGVFGVGFEVVVPPWCSSYYS